MFVHRPGGDLDFDTFEPMKTRLLIPAVALALAGCGSAPSEEDAVRDTTRNIIRALQSDNPERSCPYQADREKCAGAAVLLKDMDVSALLNIPDDWEERVDRATVKITGDTATMTGFDLSDNGKPARYIKRGGKWLSDNR